MNRVNANGLPALETPRKGRTAPRREKTTPAPWKADAFRTGMKVFLGVGVPLLSLSMSCIAGTLARAGVYWLAGFALALMLAVLGVSLLHVAWAVGDITRSDWRTSTALAVALDLSLVLTELCQVYADGLGLDAVCYAVMASVAAASMALNVYAFLYHDCYAKS